MKYKWLIVLMLSLSFGLNHLIGKFTNPDYTPFALTGVSKGGSLDEVYYYVPSINAVSFNKPLGDWQAFEYRFGPKVQPTIGPLIFGQVTKAVGLENLYIIVDFVFPPLVFLSFYYLAKLITKSELLSVLAPLVLIGKEPLESFLVKLGVSVLKYRQLDYFFDYLNNLNRPLGFARFDSPQFSFVILTLGLIMFFKAIRSKRVIFYLFAGFLFGMQWYIYSYYAIFLTLVLGSSFGVFLVQRDWEKLKFLTAAIFTAVIISAVYWWNYFQFTKLSQVMDFFYRAGRVDGRWFDNKSLWPILFILVLSVVRPVHKKAKLTLIFLVCLLSAAFLSLNFQLLTGFSVQHFHWQSVIVNPVLILASVYLLSLFKTTVLVRPVVLLVVLLTAGIFVRNWLIAENTAGAYVKNPDLEQAYDWINHNLQPEAVIMTPSLESNYWLIMKTRAYVFNPHGLHSLAPTTELIERLLLTFSLFGIDNDYLEQFLSFQSTPGTLPHTHESLDLSGYDYIFDSLSGLQSSEAKTDIAKAKATFQAAKLTWEETKKKYRLDYIFFGPSERRISHQNFAADKNLVKVFDNQVVQIFRVSD